MEAEFVEIVRKMAAERGREILFNTVGCRALLADYAGGEFKNERKFFLFSAVESGIARMIDAASDLRTCRLQQIQRLQDDYRLSPSAAAEVVDMLMLILRGDSQNAAIPQYIGSTIRFGKYDWRVLDVQNGKALILSENIIEKRRYHSYAGTAWEECELRVHLNGAFYNAFSLRDKARIDERRITTMNNPWYGTTDGNDTNDRIFLLSIEEVVDYFGDSGQLKNRPEDARSINDQHNSTRIAYDVNGAASWWWLRSPGFHGKEDFHSSYAAYVHLDGSLHIFGDFVTNETAGGGGVRPALWLNL